MFLETPDSNKRKKGWIEVICGSMFSGKTKLLIKKIRDAENNNLVVSVFKPKIDTRYNESKIVSHEKNEINAIPIKNVSDIIKLSKSANLVAIDEAQFFDDKINYLLGITSKTTNKINEANLLNLEQPLLTYY